MSLTWVEGYTNAENIVKTLASLFTDNGQDTVWQLHYPESIDEITRTAVIRKQVGSNVVYIEFHRPDTQKLDGTTQSTSNYFSINCIMGDDYTPPTDSDSPGTWGEDSASVPARWSWFKGNSRTPIKGWLPIHYWMSKTADRIAIVLRGDPAANYNDSLLSFGYFGSIKSFKDGQPDIDGNFGMTVSSDVSPLDYLTQEQLHAFSDNTGTGVLDVVMYKTLSGFPMQAHYAAFTTPDEFVPKKIEGPSEYTKKYHMSPVYLFHGYHGYRGELDGVIVSDRSSIVNLDEMIHTLDDGTKHIYKMFTVNAPYSIFNSSPNVLYAVGILKEIQQPAG